MSDILPPPASTPASSSETKMPSAAGFWIGGAIATVGVIVAAVWFFAAIVQFVDYADDFERIEVPGSATLTISEEGTYTLWVETSSQIDSFSDVREPEVRITGPEGEEVDTDPTFSTETYNTTSHHGRSFAEFRVDVVGDYTFEVFEGEGSGRDAVAVAVGESELGTLGWQIFGAVAVGVLSVLVGVVLVVVTAVRRTRRRKALAPPVPAYGYSPYAPAVGSRPPSTWGPPGGAPPSAWGPPSGVGGAPPAWGPPSAAPPPSPWGPPSGAAGVPSSPSPWGPPPGPPSVPPSGAVGGPPSPPAAPPGSVGAPPSPWGPTAGTSPWGAPPEPSPDDPSPTPPAPVPPTLPEPGAGSPVAPDDGAGPPPVDVADAGAASWPGFGPEPGPAPWAAPGSSGAASGAAGGTPSGLEAGLPDQGHAGALGGTNGGAIGFGDQEPRGAIADVSEPPVVEPTGAEPTQVDSAGGVAGGSDASAADSGSGGSDSSSSDSGSGSGD
ncbi:MAG: hypothetical protein MUF83_03450 [Acidimicrobiales bacterium]|nr:hypothetical protein [Acidimicrobiales bacterium]